MGVVLEVPYCGKVAKWRYVARMIAPPWPLATKRNLSASKITDSRPRNYGSFKFDDFVLKIAPNRCPKFGSAQKMLYLCIVNQKTGAQSKWETTKR